MHTANPLHLSTLELLMVKTFANSPRKLQALCFKRKLKRKEAYKKAYLMIRIFWYPAEIEFTEYGLPRPGIPD